MRQNYNKLVRDKIPAIIAAQGDAPEVVILNDNKYEQALNAKLQEEVSEYLNGFDIEELADILEVIRAIAAQKGVSYEAVEKIRVAKHAERGGFLERLCLVAVERGASVE